MKLVHTNPKMKHPTCSKCGCECSKIAYSYKTGWLCEKCWEEILSVDNSKEEGKKCYDEKI